MYIKVYITYKYEAVSAHKTIWRDSGMIESREVCRVEPCLCMLGIQHHVDFTTD